MRYLSLGEILSLNGRVIEQWGGAEGLRDLGGLESATAQPRMTFGGEDLAAWVRRNIAPTPRQEG